MVENFHCKLQIKRPGEQYGIQKDFISGTIRLFIPKDGANIIYAGSSDQNDIRVKGLSPEHVTLGFIQEDLFIQAKDSLEISHSNHKEKLGPKQNKRLPMFTKQDSFRCTLSFPDKSSIEIKASPEQVVLEEKARQQLESKYGYIEKIQEGDFSLLFKTNHDKVIKVLKPSHARNKGSCIRFINAARKFSTLPDSFLKIRHICYHSGLCYATMDYFPADTLENYIGKKGTMSESEAQEVVIAIAQRMQVLHSRNCILRNLSPSNVLIGSNGDLCIVGFFFLKTDSHVTMKNALMIVPGYVSPEQINDSSKVDVSTDLFALGAIYYTILMGEPPFKTNNTREYINSVASKEARPIEAKELREVNPALSSKTCEIIARLLSLDKNKRPNLETLIRELPYSEKLSISDMPLVEYKKVSEISEKPVFARDEKTLELAESLAESEKSTESPEDKSVESTMDAREELVAQLNFLSPDIQKNLELLDQETMADPKADFVKQEEIAPKQNQKEPEDIFSSDVLQKLDDMVPAKLVESNPETQSYCLSVLSGIHMGLKYLFQGNQIVTIGRQGSFCIPNDLRISKQHCRLEIKDGSFFLTDLSANGTFLLQSGKENKKLVFPTQIEINEEFMIGDTILRLETGQLMDTFLRESVLLTSDELEKDYRLKTIEDIDISTNPESPDVASLPETFPSIKIKEEKIADAYGFALKKYEERQRCRASKMPKMKEKKQPSRNSTHKKAIVCMVCLVSALAYILWPGESTPISNQSENPEPKHFPEPEKLIKDAKTSCIPGKIVWIDHDAESKIKYFVIRQKSSSEYYAVRFPSLCTERTTKLIEELYETGAEIQVMGEKKTGRGVMKLIGERLTHDYVLVSTLKVGENEYPFK